MDNTIRKAAKLRKNKTRTEKRMEDLLSRLAREVKVVRVSGIVSGFRGCGLRRSPGSAELRRAAFPPRRIQDSGSRGISSRLTVARRRRFCTVFPARSLRLMWRSVSSGAGFSLWSWVPAITNPHRRKPVPLNPPNFAEALSLQLCKASQPRHCCLQNRLRHVLAAASAQIHARPARRTKFHIQRRVKHLLE